ncbi:hypothetical protein [Kitasatospora sp. NPDC057198]|uniref:hypothetical protein n=1 Tax=Kitasatospora sp. NPDC057198 TaxID=3346046 RepID=UPI00362D0481
MRSSDGPAGHHGHGGQGHDGHEQGQGHDGHEQGQDQGREQGQDQGRGGQGRDGAGGAPRAGRRGLVPAVSAAVLVAVAVGAGLVYLPGNDHPAAAPAPTATASPSPTREPRLGGPALPDLPPNYVAPLDSFLPATVKLGLAKPYERVSATDLTDCADPSMPERERGIVRKAGRCVALQLVVYGDADNRYTFWVLTMRTLSDALALQSELRRFDGAEPEEPYRPVTIGIADRTVWLWTATAVDPAKPADRNRLDYLADEICDRWIKQVQVAREERLVSEPPLV